ncbi:MAG: hypothetical protein ACTHMQ_03700 [Protaetiibacter sp.]
MSELLDVRSLDVESRAVETQRIIRTGTVWLAAAVLAPLIGLGPLVASGWRPFELPPPAQLAFWLGAVAAAVGLAGLVWAGCPVLGFRLPQAYKQKVVSIRVGIVLNVSGMALCGLAILLSPA